MYLFLPFLNQGINNINRKTYKKIVIFLIGFFSFYNMVGVLLNKSNYHFLNGGYTTLWIIILYVIGGYFGKYIIKDNNNSNIKYYFFYIFVYICSSFISSEIYFIKKNQKYNGLLIINL